MTAVGLYVHVPFCAAKCGYCDFYSRTGEPREMHRLIGAMVAELADGPVARRDDLRIETIFVGGGTPTVLPEPTLEALFSALGQLAKTHAVTEFTVEANPASLDGRKAELLRRCGVDRLSVGAQSFDAAELAVLDRIHGPHDVAETVARVRAAGIRNLNLDLIFGVPGQTVLSWASSLRQALDLEPEHLACYGLTYEPGTPMHRRRAEGRITPADEDAEAEMYLLAIDTLASAGFDHYEISNFARPGSVCRHNLKYWHNEPYVGIGPSAVSYLDGCRWRNVADIRRYVAGMTAGRPNVVEQEQLGARGRAAETAMMWLRLTDGVDRAAFEAATGAELEVLFGDAIRTHAAAGLLEVTERGVRLTRRGLLVADSVLADFADVVDERGRDPQKAACDAPNAPNPRRGG